MENGYIQGWEASLGLARDLGSGGGSRESIRVTLAETLSSGGY